MSKRLRLAFAVLVVGAVGPLSRAMAEPGNTIVVRTSVELQAALGAANAGRRIVVLAGEYDVDGPLVVPDGATLEGEGVMLFDDDGLPRGFQAGTDTRLKAASAFDGNLLTLGDGVVVRGIAVEDLLGRNGAVVVVASRRARDSVSAEIHECEIVAPNSSDVGPDGPIGRGLLVFTQNPNFGGAEGPHVDSVVRAEMTRSIVHAPNGASAVFGTNFAAGGRVTVALTRNRLEGDLDAPGGVSRPDAVVGARLTIRSRENLWSRLGGLGWQINGGTTVPFPLPAPSTSFDTARIFSDGDRIERFNIGIFAIGGQRWTGASDVSSNNRTEICLRSTRIRTESVDSPAVDFLLEAAVVDVDGFAPGDGNVLSFSASGVDGSGSRANGYANAAGPSGPGSFGTGNRLEVSGTPEEFARSNRGIDPPPGAEFFTGDGGSACDRDDGGD